MKLGEMQLDYDINGNYGFFERRKRIKEGKRLVELHPEYGVLQKDDHIKNASEYYMAVLRAYLKDCIIKEDPEGEKLYVEKRQKDIKHFQNEFYSQSMTDFSFLREYNDLLRERTNPGILEKEHQERIAKQEQLQIQSKIRDRLAQQELQQDLANGTRVICPYCKSVDTKKLTALNRAVSVSLVGAASGKIGKQWHCNHCGSDF